MLSKHGKFLKGRMTDLIETSHDASHHIGYLRMGKSPSISFGPKLGKPQDKNLFIVGSHVSNGV